MASTTTRTTRTIRPARAALVDGVDAATAKTLRPDQVEARPVRPFTLNVHAVADWVAAHDGRMPSTSGGTKDPVERRHGQFLNHVREAARGRGGSARAFTAERRALLDRLVPGWNVDRDIVFSGHVHAVADWMHAHDGQTPRTTAKDPVERRHGQFLTHVREAARGRGNSASTFTAERRALLDRLVPGWEGVDGGTIFDRHVHELADWASAHDGRVPSQHAKDPVERRHGKFLDNCRQAARGHRGSARAFTAERRALLDRLVPGWNVDRDTAFDLNVHKVADWVNTHNGRMPSKGAKDPVERRSGSFLHNCRTAARGGSGAGAFTTERRALLDRLVPGWEGERAPR